MAEYLNTDDPNESDNEPGHSHPAWIICRPDCPGHRHIVASEDPPTRDDDGTAKINMQMVTLAAQQLIAAREAIDATLLAFGAIFDKQQPTTMATCEEDIDCSHPADRRQLLKTIGGSATDPEWLCTECGYQHINK